MFRCSNKYSSSLLPSTDKISNFLKIYFSLPDMYLIIGSQHALQTSSPQTHITSTILPQLIRSFRQSWAQVISHRKVFRRRHAAHWVMSDPVRNPQLGIRCLCSLFNAWEQLRRTQMPLRSQMSCQKWKGDSKCLVWVLKHLCLSPQNT